MNKFLAWGLAPLFLSTVLTTPSAAVSNDNDGADPSPDVTPATQPAEEALPAPEITTDPAPEVDLTITFETKAEPERSEPPEIWEMNFDELMDQHNGNYTKAWEQYEFYQLRRIYLNGSVTESSVNKAITQIRTLDTLEPGETINVVINSPGGSVYDGLRLYNVFRTVESPIHTIGNNMVASMGAVLLMGGDERSLYSNCRVLIHEVAGGSRGQTTDMVHELIHMEELQDELYQIISENSGLSMRDVRLICERDIFYDAEDALLLGFADQLVPEKPTRDIEPGSRAVPEHLLPEHRREGYYERRDAREAPAPQRAPG